MNPSIRILQFPSKIFFFLSMEWLFKIEDKVVWSFRECFKLGLKKAIIFIFNNWTNFVYFDWRLQNHGMKLNFFSYNLGAKLIFWPQQKYGYLEMDALMYFVLFVMVSLKKVTYGTHLLLSWWDASHTKFTHGHDS